MWKRVAAILIARNREFYRDKAGLIWNIMMPVMMIVAFAFIFGGGPEDLFKVGVLGDPQTATDESGFLATPYLDFVPLADEPAAVTKVARHQLDLLIDALSYADWALPGVLAMNVMFSSLWGVGWVVVRYRKNGVLRRLKATPLKPLEFLSAQVLSRLLVVMASSTVVYLGALVILDFPMRGSYAALALIYIASALSMISLGLLVAARLRTEELADGLLNLMAWPMLLLSGVWFSMEGTSTAAQWLSQLMPLTHVVGAARGIMIDGAGVLDVLPELLLLLALAAALLAAAARLFRWE